MFRTGLGAVCLLAGIEKAQAPGEFFEGVRQYRLVPARFAPVVGGALIAAELGLGLLLVTGLVPALAALGAIVLFSIFAAALGVSLARSNTAPCHCFGASEIEKISPVALVRALALAGVAAAVLVFALQDTASIGRHELLPVAADDRRLRRDHAPLGPVPARVVVPAAEGVHAPDARRGASASGTSRSTIPFYPREQK